MNVLVTGGAGFIGANLCRHLARDESISRLVVLDDLSTGRRSNLDGVDVDLVEGSILDTEVVDHCCTDIEVIVHLAARPSVPRSIEDPVSTHRVNTDGTVEVLEAARRHGLPHLVVASSSSVYGANPTLPKQEDLAPLPLSPYAASKLATEAYVLSYQSAFGLPALTFRFFNVFGPLQPAAHDYAAVVPAFVSAAIEDRPLPVFGDGRQTRDFTFVDTVSTVIASAIRRKVTAESAVNLAFGTRTDLLTLISQLETLIGHDLAVEHHEPRPGDVRDSQADTTRLRSLFPDVEPVGLAAGLKATIEWFRTEQ